MDRKNRREWGVRTVDRSRRGDADRFEKKDRNGKEEDEQVVKERTSE
jgi:hypothetical protein